MIAGAAQLAARLPMPGANFGGAPGRASHHQSPRHMPWQPGGGAGEPEYYDGDAALVHADGDLDDEEGGAFDEVGGDEIASHWLIPARVLFAFKLCPKIPSMMVGIQSLTCTSPLNSCSSERLKRFGLCTKAGTRTPPS